MPKYKGYNKLKEGIEIIESRQLDLFVNLGAYKLKYVLIRTIITSITAVLLIFFVGKMTDAHEVLPKLKFGIYLVAIIGFNSVTELNLMVMRIYQKSRFCGNFYLQLLTMVVITFGLALVWVKVAEIVLQGNNLLQESITQITLIIALLIVVIHLLVIVLSSQTKNWLVGQQEIENLKQAKLLSDYNSLKDRLNPHFLFNNLSVLKSLIRFDSEKAEIFTQNFTNVYRYLLNSHESAKVSLAKELEFVEWYISLHKERIGDGLVINLNIEEHLLQKEIPPMSIQLLMENAIKHNVVSKAKPLIIDVYTEDDQLVVKNTINLKETTYSTKTGLATLNGQLKLLANRELNVESTSDYYLVKLPLL